MYLHTVHYWVKEIPLIGHLCHTMLYYYGRVHGSAGGVPSLAVTRLSICMAWHD